MIFYKRECIILFHLLSERVIYLKHIIPELELLSQNSEHLFGSHYHASYFLDQTVIASLLN